MAQPLQGPARALCRDGVALLGLGLLTGLAIPVLANPRMGLSAHLAGVQSGMLLAILGLLWPSLALGARAAHAARILAVGSLYATWLGILLAAVFGASRALPIAGAAAPSRAAPWQEAVVALLVGGGAVAILAATVLILRGLLGHPTVRAGAPNHP